MGFWYFLMLFLGIALLAAGALKKDVPRSTKVVILLFILGIALIAVSLFMFMPGSAEIVSQILNLH